MVSATRVPNRATALGGHSFVEAGRRALAGEMIEAVPSVNFATYDDMHQVLAPSRLAIVKALAGQGALSIREVAR